MSWIEFAVDADPEAAESVSELLSQYGYNGGVVLEQPIITGLDGPEYSFDTARPVTLRTYVPLDEQTEDIRVRLEQALWHLGRMRTISDLRVTALEEQDWANAWKQHYSIHRIGERTVIVPSWLDYAPQPNDIVLRLDPGMAFGTGLHPTTQLCLIFLEHYVQSDIQALDLGCGSGILTIAAALAGAKHVLALDTDPIAVEATNANVVINGVAAQVTAAEGSLGAGIAVGHWLSPDFAALDATRGAPRIANDYAFDLIVANIIARVLSAVAPDMIAALKPGGLLISSGIIAEREDEVTLAYAAAGLERIERRQQGDWVALVHRKPYMEGR